MLTIAPQLGHALLLLIVLCSIVLMLLRPYELPEVYWVGGGALLLVCLGLFPVKLAGRAVAEGADVYLFLVGMMLLSALADANRVFDWLSARAVGAANRSSAKLFTLVYGIGTLTTILLSNDATAVVLTPAVLAGVRRAKVEPRPYLFACAFIANAASFVLPISNPANLVMFRDGMPPLNRWLLSFGLPSVLSIVVTYALLRVMFRTHLKRSIEADVQIEPLPANGKVVLFGIGCVVAVLLTASAIGLELGMPTCVAALVITGLVSLKERCYPWRLLREVSWGTLALVAALFVMVDAVESMGALQYTGTALRHLQEMSPANGAFTAGLVTAVANNLTNNLPLGLIAGSTLQATHTKGLLANAVLIGVDLGPNLSVTGSLATILWLLALRREEIRISFWQFLRVGAVVMPVALLVSIGGAVLMRSLLKVN